MFKSIQTIPLILLPIDSVYVYWLLIHYTNIMDI